MASVDIHQLVYVSRYPSSLSGADIQSILATSRTNNERNGITGILMSRGGYFLQVLEGDRFDVCYTYKKVRDDRRHDRLQVILEQPAGHRLFERWAMDYREFDDVNLEFGQFVSDMVEERRPLTGIELLAKISTLSSI